MTKTCPICEAAYTGENTTGIITDDGEEQYVTSLCSPCNEARFFDEDFKEIRYRSRFAAVITLIRQRFASDYSPILHDDIVDGMVRAQIQTYHYEKLVSNNREGSTGTLYQLLSMERNHMRSLLDKLNISLQAMRKDKKGATDSVPTDFGKLMEDMLAKGDIDIESLTTEAEVEE